MRPRFLNEICHNLHMEQHPLVQRLEMKKGRRLWSNFAVWIFCLLFLIPTTVALANSLPPPFQIYFRFFSSGEAVPAIHDVQLVGCEDITCTSQSNLIQYGDCSAIGFLTEKPLLQESWQLSCAGARCLFNSDFHEAKSLPPYLRVITLHNDHGRASQVIPTPECDYCTVAWKIDLGAPEPLVSEDEEFINPNQAFRGFFLTYLLTILVEISVAAIITGVFRKTLQLSTRKLVLATLLANLLSYPISWLVIPSFGQFQMDLYRKTGFLIIAAIGIATVVSIYLQRNHSKIKRGTIVALIIGVPVCGVLSLVCVFLISYGNHQIHVNGLPWTMVVILAELFAVLFEGTFISILFKGEFSYKKALLISLAVNAASFLLGLFLF